MISKGYKLRARSIPAALVVAGSLAGSLTLGPVAYAAGIAKCQDADGNWHYGNFAADECEKSEVTKLSNKGTEVGKIPPPPTKEELEEKRKKKQEKAKSEKQKKEQRARDQNLVRTYGSEEDIISTRDRKLASIDNNVEVARQIKAGVLQDIEQLKGRKQTDKVKKLIKEREQAITSYDKVIMQSLAEREKLEAKYVEILEDYRAATNRLASGG